jgi:hypothetical protein
MAPSAFTRSLGGIASLSLALAALCGAAAAQDQAAPAPQPHPVTEGQVQAASLGELDLWSNPGRDTGLPPDLWRGAAADLVRTTLEPLGDKPLDPALAALARRTLATGANAPEGGGNDVALAGLRERTLLALGDAPAAFAILSRASNLETSEARSRVKAEAALILGRDADACATGDALQENRNGSWWLKLRAYCSLVAGKPEAGQILLDLWRQGGGKDPTFDRLATAAFTGAAGGKTPLKASLSDPLNYGLSKRLKLDLAPALAEASPGIVAAIAADENEPPALRIAAAARGLRLGLVSPDAARTIYAAAPLAPPDAAGGAGAPPPPTVADLADKPGAESEAALWAIASQSPDPVQRGQAADAILRRAKGAAEFEALSRLVDPAIAFTVKANAPLQDPVLLATAAAAAGDAAAAQAIRGGIEQDKSADSTPLDLALLDAIMAVSADKPADPVLDRLVERGAVGDAKLRVRAQAAALLLAAAGASMSPQARAQFAAFDIAAAKAAAGRAAALDLAGSGHRPGEAAILAISIGLQQPSGLTAADRANIVSALRRSGLPGEARAVALEGLIGLARP